MIVRSGVAILLKGATISRLIASTRGDVTAVFSFLARVPNGALPWLLTKTSTTDEV